MKSGTKLFQCHDCNDRFTEKVWHCPKCMHHWPESEKQCRNCYRKRFKKQEFGK